MRHIPLALGLFIAFGPLLGGDFSVGAQLLWNRPSGDLRSYLQNNDCKDRDARESKTFGGIVGLHGEYNWKPGQALRLRAEIGSYPEITQDAIRQRNQYLNLALDARFNLNGTNRGAYVVAGPSSVWWVEEKNGRETSTHQFGLTLGTGYQWKHFGVEMRLFRCDVRPQLRVSQLEWGFSYTF